MHPRTITLVVFALLIPIAAGFGADTKAFSRSDYRLYSGEVNWNVLYETAVPITQFDDNLRPDRLTDAQYEDWKKKQANPRSQRYMITAIFKSDYLLFTTQTDPGDIQPSGMNETLVYNGASFIIINHITKTLSRSPSITPFRQSVHGHFYYPPRAFGFDLRGIQGLIKQVKNRAGEWPRISKVLNRVEAMDSIQMSAAYDNGEKAVLANLEPDKDHAGVFAAIRYISPIAGEQVHIENSQWKTYPDGTAYPSQTIVTRYRSSDLRNATDELRIDRMTLTVEEAKFNEDYPDEIFNPYLPEGYQDLNDARRAIRDTYYNE